MSRKLSQQEERQVELRVESQQNCYNRGHRFKIAHQYKSLIIEPTLSATPGNDTPMIQVWFMAALKDEQFVDDFLRKIDTLIVSGTVRPADD